MFAINLGNKTQTQTLYHPTYGEVATVVPIFQSHIGLIILQLQNPFS